MFPNYTHGRFLRVIPWNRKEARRKNGGQNRVTTSLCGCHPERSDCRDQQSRKRNEVEKQQHVMKLLQNGGARYMSISCALLNLALALSASLHYPVETESSLANWDISPLVATCQSIPDCHITWSNRRVSCNFHTNAFHLELRLSSACRPQR
jgi:fructose-1,6-bisphosphatase/inositol monophosphatase family enzyme